ncbi:MAG: tetratricopeptide repeat protein [Bradyrhizobium sp.]|nr:tetratricopeptide repeat protein [Bradyrhizobium sp.]
MNRQEHREAAASDQAKASALYEAALQHMKAGRSLDGQLCCQRALVVDPNHAGTLHLMALLFLQHQQYDHALEWVARALRQEAKPAYFLSLGTILQLQGRHDEALRVVNQAIELTPDNADLWMLRGSALVNLKRPADALPSFRQVLKFDPQHWGAARQCGIILQSQGLIEESLAYLSLCNALRPNDVPTLLMCAALLNTQKRFEEALTLCRRAHAFEPINAAICDKIGIVLRALRKDEEALQWFDKALALQPNFRDALQNRAAALTKLHRFHEAFGTYERLKIADPNDALAELGIAHLHLLTGNFAAGWTGREARWKIARSYPHFSQPMWLGNEPLQDKTILVAADEGLGDTIQFVRYAPALAKLGARIVLVVQDSLYPLLSHLPDVSQCIPLSRAGDLPAFDFHCPLMSLPLAFRTRLDTIPSARSYLSVPDQHSVRTWKERLGPHDRLRVGLAWSGNPNHLDDHNRSIPLRTFSGMLGANAAYISLQRDPNSEDKAALLELPAVIDLTGHFADFVETAALINCLDLVITVDTSVAHLAAALGCPTWMLLSYTPDYRWLLDRDDSPWYPTMRLFRQDETRQWPEVIDRVRRELEMHAALFSPSWICINPAAAVAH